MSQWLGIYYSAYFLFYIFSIFLESRQKYFHVFSLRRQLNEGCSIIVDDILSIQAISGCDTVSPYHGIGKTTALKTATDKHTT